MPDKETDPEVEVRVDGVPLGLVPWVKKMIGGTLVGMITTLNGAENAREIEIRVRRER